MRTYDDDPPKHASVGDLRHPERLDIHKQTSVQHGSFLDWFFKSRTLYLTAEEIRVLILHKESPVICNGSRMSKKAYNKALEQQEKARIWLEEEKQLKSVNDDEHTTNN